MAETKILKTATIANREEQQSKNGHRTTWLWDNNRHTAWKTSGIMITIIAVMSALAIVLPPGMMTGQRMPARILTLGIFAAIDAIGTTYGGDKSRFTIFMVTLTSVIWLWPGFHPDDVRSWGMTILTILVIVLWVGCSFATPDNKVTSTPVTLGIVTGTLLCIFKPAWITPIIETITPYAISLLLTVGMICSLRRTDDRSGDCSLVTAILIRNFEDFYARHAMTIFTAVVTVRLLLCSAAALLMIRLYVFPELTVLTNTLIPPTLLPYV